ncbi:putative olfactory receptor [Crotalus adamanteus]|uniref:Olfactory receptor n=1 Tax=Crotalus adamanteus TaxID=8729 RepID=A0AAW1B8F4_CROAD
MLLTTSTVISFLCSAVLQGHNHTEKVELCLNSSYCPVFTFPNLSTLYLHHCHHPTHSIFSWQTKGIFNLCFSHYFGLGFFYGCSIFMYLLPEKIHSSGFYKGVALLHTVVTPLLNPFIYTLQNEKIKEVFKDTLK